MAQELTSLVDIDFLPEFYRQRSMHRRAYAWRAAAAATILAFLALTSLWQHKQYASARSKLGDVEVEFVEAAGENANLAQLTAQLQAERKHAELLTFLRHRWPRTLILTAIVESLPPSVVLTECHVDQETVESRQPPAIALPEAKTAPPSRSARQANDLALLLHESAQKRHFVSLVGKADDAATLHAYLAQLGTNPLFARIDLQSLEHLTTDSSDTSALGTMHFTVRAFLRPGHGETLLHEAPPSETPPTEPPPAPQGA